MSDDWQAAQHQDECLRQQAVIEALLAAYKAGTPEDKLMTIAVECGVANDFYKEIRP